MSGDLSVCVKDVEMKVSVVMGSSKLMCVDVVILHSMWWPS